MLAPDKTTFHFSLKKVDRKKLQHTADDIGTTPGALVRMLVVDYLKKHQIKDELFNATIPKSESQLP